jgi:hypothetical protein
MYDNITACNDWGELGKLTAEADLYTISNHWEITVQPTYQFRLIQPWIKRYAPTHDLAVSVNVKWSRLWIDQDLKEAMGY